MTDRRQAAYGVRQSGPYRLPFDAHERAEVLVEPDVADAAGGRHLDLGDLVAGHGEHLLRAPVGIDDGRGHGDVVDLRALLEDEAQGAPDRRLAVGAGRGDIHLLPARPQHGDVGAVDPPLEEPHERAAVLGLHRRAQVVGPHAAEPALAVEPLQAAGKRRLPHQSPQHVQHEGALVVHGGAKDPAVALHVPEPVAEPDRPLVADLEG